MGTEFTLVLYTGDPALANRASRAAFDRIHALDVALTDYEPASELMRLVDSGRRPARDRSSDDLFAVLSRAKELHDRSGGAFDPSIAPVVRLWRRARREKKLPDPDLARPGPSRLVGGDAIRLDADPSDRRVDPAGDEARPRRDRQGVRLGRGDRGPQARGDHLGAGGRLGRHRGSATRPPASPAGRSGLPRSPPSRKADGTLGRTILLKNAAVSTSGDAEQFVEIDGKRYSHVVDPENRPGPDRPPERHRRSPPKGSWPTGSTTAACVLGLEAKGFALVESYPGRRGPVRPDHARRPGRGRVAPGLGSARPPVRR